MRARVLAVLLGVIVALWCVQPVVQRHLPGQDLLPYRVQGSFVGVRDDLVFLPEGATYAELPGEVVAAQCGEAADMQVRDGFDLELGFFLSDCVEVVAPPVAPPIALPVWVALAHLSPEAAGVVVRLLGALCFAAGFVVLWRRLSAQGDAGRLTVVLTAAAMTPLVWRTGQLAQLSPLLFVSATLCPLGGRRPRNLAAAAVWSLAVVVKAFPVLLVGVQVDRRRWTSLAVLAGTIVGFLVATVALVPVDVVTGSGAAGSTLLSSALGVPSNRSVAAALAAATGWDGPIGVAILTGVALVVVALAWWRWLRGAAPEVEWAWWSAAVAVAMPVLWSHYTPTVVAALAMALASRGSSRDVARHGTDGGWLPDRTLLALPVLAGVLGVFATTGDAGPGAAVRLATMTVSIAALVGIVVAQRRGALGGAAMIAAS